MNYQFNKQTAALAVIGMFAIFVDDAAASASFTSYATISFSIENIVGTSNDYSALELSGSFMRSGDGFPVTWVTATGDGVVADNNPEIPSVTSAVSIGSAYSHTFALNGQVSNGSIDFNQVGWHDLGFFNRGSESFDITLNFSYELSTAVVGQAGNTSAGIEYWDDLGGVYGLDEIVATSQLPEISNVFRANGGQFTFTLDSLNSSRTLYVDVNHSGYLQASPVPLPAAVWSFLVGLVSILGVKKHKRIKTEDVI